MNPDTRTEEQRMADELAEERMDQGTMTHASALAFSRLHAEICATPINDRVNNTDAFVGKLNELSRHAAVVKAAVQDQISLPAPHWVSLVDGDNVTVRSDNERQVVFLSNKRRKVQARWFFTRAHSVRAVDTLFEEEEPVQLTRAGLSDTDEYAELYRCAAEAHKEWEEARFKTLFVPAVCNKAGDGHTLFLDLSSVDPRFEVQEETKVPSCVNWIEIDQSVSGTVLDEFRFACARIRRASGSEQPFF